MTYTSAADTADSWIERRFLELSQAGFTNMVVATDDNVSIKIYNLDIDLYVQIDIYHE